MMRDGRVLLTRDAGDGLTLVVVGNAAGDLDAMRVSHESFRDVLRFIDDERAVRLVVAPELLSRYVEGPDGYELVEAVGYVVEPGGWSFALGFLPAAKTWVVFNGRKADAGECPFDGLVGCARGSCRLFGDEMRAFEVCPAWKKQDAAGGK